MSAVSVRRLKERAKVRTCQAIVLSVLLASAAIVGLRNELFAADWPQFLGLDRNGVYRGEDLAPSWPRQGPRVIWKKRVGQGFSAPVIASGRVILFHRIADEEIVQALEARTGKEQWSFRYPTTYRDSFGFDEGPRASPAVANGRVYSFGAQGFLHCLQLETGKEIWSVDTKKKFRVRKGFFGVACSPLVDAGGVFLNVGGGNGAGLVAFDRGSGKVLWKATKEKASYSSPTAAVFSGKPHILFFTRSGLVGTDRQTGEVLFRFPWRARIDSSINAATPLVIGDLIFLSTSYGTGAVLLRVKGGELKQVWSSDRALTNHYATSVHFDGHLYGFHGRQEYRPSFRCVELMTGKVRWSEKRFGAGTVTLAGDRLVVATENGELVLARATPEKFELISKAKILPGTVRAHTAIDSGLLYARNKNTLICVSLRRGN